VNTSYRTTEQAWNCLRKADRSSFLLCYVQVFVCGRWRWGIVLADLGRRVSLAVAVAPVVTLTVATVVIALADILHLAIAVRAPRPIAITAVIVALAAVVLARRESLTVATRGGAATTRGALAASTIATLGTLTTRAVAARVEAPRCGGRGACPLDLQQVIAADALVVHLMVRVIGIATALVLHKGEQPARS
jgi:hypothetical protein